MEHIDPGALLARRWALKEQFLNFKSHVGRDLRLAALGASHSADTAKDDRLPVEKFGEVEYAFNHVAAAGRARH